MLWKVDGHGPLLLLVVPARPYARALARPDAVHVGEVFQELLLLLVTGYDSSEWMS